MTFFLLISFDIYYFQACTQQHLHGCCCLMWEVQNFCFYYEHEKEFNFCCGPMVRRNLFVHWIVYKILGKWKFSIPLWIQAAWVSFPFSTNLSVADSLSFRVPTSTFQIVLFVWFWHNHHEILLSLSCIYIGFGSPSIFFLSLKLSLSLGVMGRSQRT